jgi:hypothetical protein
MNEPTSLRSPSTPEFLQALSNVLALRIRSRVGAFQDARLDNVSILAANEILAGITDLKEVLLTWPDSLVPFELVTCDPFALPWTWTTNVAYLRRTLNKGLHQVDVLATNRTRFFELRLPQPLP